METSIIKNEIMETERIKSFSIGDKDFALFKMKKTPYDYLLGQKLPDNTNILDQIGISSVLKTINNSLYLIVSTKQSYWDCLDVIENLNRTSNTPLNLEEVFNELYQYPLAKRLDCFNKDGIFSQFKIIFELGHLIKPYTSALEMLNSLHSSLTNRRDYSIEYGVDSIHIIISNILIANDYIDKSNGFGYNSFFNQRNTILRHYNDIKNIKNIDMDSIDALLDSMDLILDKAAEEHIFSFPDIKEYSDPDYNNTFGILEKFITNEFPNLDTKHIHICSEKSKYYQCTGVVISTASYQGFLCYLVFITSPELYGAIDYIFIDDLESI